MKQRKVPAFAPGKMRLAFALVSFFVATMAWIVLLFQASNISPLEIAFCCAGLALWVTTCAGSLKAQYGHGIATDEMDHRVPMLQLGSPRLWLTYVASQILMMTLAIRGVEFTAGLLVVFVLIEVASLRCFITILTLRYR